MENTTPSGEEAAKEVLAKKRAEMAKPADGAAGAEPGAEALRREAFEAFAKAQSEFEALTFDSENPHFKNKYASLKATLKATLPALNKHGIALMTLTSLSGESIVAETVLVYKGLVFATAEWFIGKMTTPPQQLGSALTYARRYTTQGITGVAGEEDDDGNAAQGKKPAEAEKDPF